MAWGVSSCRAYDAGPEKPRIRPVVISSASPCKISRHLRLSIIMPVAPSVPTISKYHTILQAIPLLLGPVARRAGRGARTNVTRTLGKYLTNTEQYAIMGR